MSKTYPIKKDNHPSSFFNDLNTIVEKLKGVINRLEKIKHV